MIQAIIRTVGFGEMRFELFPGKAPLTVASFADTANSSFYDGLEWCRVVRGYVIQAGSPDNDIMTDSDFHLKGEFSENGVNTGLDHRRGAISMARDAGYDTAGTQFFIVHRMRTSWTAVMPRSATWCAGMKSWIALPLWKPMVPNTGTIR